MPAGVHFSRLYVHPVWGLYKHKFAQAHPHESSGKSQDLELLFLFFAESRPIRNSVYTSADMGASQAALVLKNPPVKAGDIRAMGSDVPYGEVRASQVLSDKESACHCRRCGYDPWVGKIPWRRKGHPTRVFLSGKFLGQWSLASYSPWDRQESDMTVAEHTRAHVCGETNMGADTLHPGMSYSAVGCGSC